MDEKVMEALDVIMSELDLVKYGDALDVIRGAIDVDRDNGEDWKARYDELYDKYTTRFKEEFYRSQPINGPDTRGEEESKAEIAQDEITTQSLDWDGSTE